MGKDSWWKIYSQIVQRRCIFKI